MQILPFLSWWPRVTKNTIRADLQAGIIGSLIVMPQGVAFATIAGMPPVYGLFTGMIPTIIAALFGSSWLLVSGPATAASLVLFSSLSQIATPTSHEYIVLALTTTFMVGVIQLSLGLIRFGSLVNFISHSVISGFTAGAAVLIITSQARSFFGLDYPRAADFQQTIRNLFTHIGEADIYAVLIGIVTIATGIVIKRLWPKLPNLILSILAGSCLYLLLFQLMGSDKVTIKTVGALPAALPPLAVPVLTFENIKHLAPAALAMALLCLTEAISIARALAEKTGQELDGNQEFIGQGLSNLIGCFFSGYVATGSFNRSAINYEAGAKTPLAAIFAGLFLIPALLFLAPLTAYLPKASLAGLLFLVAWRLIDFSYAKRVLRASKSEAVIMLTTFLATLFLELQFAILLGIMQSLAIYLNRTSHPHIHSRVPNPALKNRSFVASEKLPECPQLKIIKIEGSLYFGALHHTRNMIRTLSDNPQQRHLLLLFDGVNFIDMSGEDFLLSLARERQKNGGDLYFCNVKEDICNHCSLDEFTKGISQDHIFQSKNNALAGIFGRLDMKICRNCERRIFEECKNIPAPEK